MRASHSSSSSGGRALRDGNEPTTPALHCAITRSGTEMMKSGEPITGIDRRPLNKAGMDIAEQSFVGRRIEGWEPYQQGNLSTVKYCVLTPVRTPLPQFQVAEFPLHLSPGRGGICNAAAVHAIRSGLIRRSNENISSHFPCVSSLRSTTTIWCSDLPLL